MTSLLILSAFVIGIHLGRKHRPALPVSTAQFEFLEKIGRTPDFGPTDHSWLERER